MANQGGPELAFDLPALPERVWDALTNPVKLDGWLGQNDFQPRVGHPFTLHPRPATGLDGPITGEVTEVEAPHRLVMAWRTPAGDLTMTWLVESGRGGSRLRVVPSSGPGPDRPEPADTATQASYHRLFDEQLRGFLRSGMIAHIYPPPRPTQRPSLFEPRHEPDPELVSSPVGTFDVIPAERRPWEPRPHRVPRRSWRDRGRFLKAVAVAAVLALALTAWALTRSGPLSSWGAPGQQGTPLGPDWSDPTSTATGPAGTNPGGPPGGPSGTSSAAPGNPAPTPAESTGPGPPPLAVSASRVVSPPLAYTATVTVANPGGQPQVWQNTRVTLGLNLSVSNVDSTVRFRADGNGVCFWPSDATATVAAGGTVSFTFDVTALLPNVLGDDPAAVLNDPGC